jgi:hypothetical protein
MDPASLPPVSDEMILQAIAGFVYRSFENEEDDPQYDLNPKEWNL